MKRNKYNAPEIEIIEINPEGVIASSAYSEHSIGVHEEGEGLAAGSKKRGFWEE